MHVDFRVEFPWKMQTWKIWSSSSKMTRPRKNVDWITEIWFEAWRYGKWKRWKGRRTDRNPLRRHETIKKLVSFKYYPMRECNDYQINCFDRYRVCQINCSLLTIPGVPYKSILIVLTESMCVLKINYCILAIPSERAYSYTSLLLILQCLTFDLSVFLYKLKYPVLLMIGFLTMTLLSYLNSFCDHLSLSLEKSRKFHFKLYLGCFISNTFMFVHAYI